VKRDSRRKRGEDSVRSKAAAEEERKKTFLPGEKKTVNKQKKLELN
jgi:hypothetical protein